MAINKQELVANKAKNFNLEIEQFLDNLKKIRTAEKRLQELYSKQSREPEPPEPSRA